VHENRRQEKQQQPGQKPAVNPVSDQSAEHDLLQERPEQGATVVAKAFYFAQKVATIASKISCTNLSTSQELTARSSRHYPRTTPAALQKFAKFLKKFLHLWKFPVISQLRTNFAEMPGKTHQTWEPREAMSSSEDQGRRGGESESLEEAAIEIGNS
jgi:hypothetical protein